MKKMLLTIVLFILYLFMIDDIFNCTKYESFVGAAVLTCLAVLIRIEQKFDEKS